MRQKRAKSYRKQMAYIHMNFKFREPYQVLVDEEIILEAIKTKTDLEKALGRTLQGKIKPMITQCAMEALYRTNNQEAIELARSFERRRCNHIPVRAKEPAGSGHTRQTAADGEREQEKKDEPELKQMSAFDCMLSIVNVKGQNKHRYVVATQKSGLRGVLRKVPAVPLIYINRSVTIMEPMSPATEKARAAIESSKLTDGLNNVVSGSGEPEKAATKKRKGPKEPNPLSVKKRSAGETETETAPRRKRVRHHNRAKKAEAREEPAAIDNEVGNDASQAASVAVAE